MKSLHFSCRALDGSWRAAITAVCVSLLFASPLAGIAQQPATRSILSATPPMGWNDWAHYQCNFNSQTIVNNAKMLVKTGLAAKGYNTVTIDDCWMQPTRDSKGDLQVDKGRFPSGMKPVADEVHALGLKFGIYEDAGYATCGGYAGSGVPKGGGKDHFLQDAKLFTSWGVDYLKLDGCNVYAPGGKVSNDAYRSAYKAQSEALKAVKRPIVFSESAPAYFQGTPAWYDVLSWVGPYGQLWREGSDVEVYNLKKPERSRFNSVLWNYAYNLELARFQKPGNWNDADFIIGGDHGMTNEESRSQFALWSMMSAPLILSSDISKMTPDVVSIVGNKSILAVDQDALGKSATLIARTKTSDLLLKPLQNGDYAIAALNRGSSATDVRVSLADLGFSSTCRVDARDLWTGASQSSQSNLSANIASHDTAIWQIHPSAACGKPTRTGTITTITPGNGDSTQEISAYSRCLSAAGTVGICAAAPAEHWTVGNDGTLQSGGKCLTADGSKLAMQACTANASQRWKYSLVGNLTGTGGKCLSSAAGDSLTLAACGHNLPSQIWTLPNR